MPRSNLFWRLIVDITDFHDVVPCFRGCSAATGAKIPGVERSAVVLGEHHPFIVVAVKSMSK